MLDSINFIIDKVIEIDTKKLIGLGIIYHRFKYKINQYGKPDIYYGRVQENEAGIISTGIEFTYQGILFQHYAEFKCVIVVANAHKVLQKQDILLSDRDTFKEKVESIMKQVINMDFTKPKVHRIDNCVDIEMPQDEINERIILLYKHKTMYQHIKRLNEYDTSIYLTSKNGQRNINIYDKYQREKDKYLEKYQYAEMKTGISLAEYEIQHPTDYERYKNILRVEVQNTKVLIQKESKRIYEKYNKDNSKIIRKFPKNPVVANQMEKNLYGYWNKEFMGIYYFNFLKDYLYTGTYYKLRIAKRMIKKSTELTENEKVQLIEFITAVNKYGISGVTQTNSKTKHKMWCGATVNKYIKDLDRIGIYTFEADENKEFDFENAKDIISNARNYSNNWKLHLTEFLKAVIRYGVDDLIATNNNQIVNNNNTARHKTWCFATVEKYINMLERLKINPVTLDNNSKFDSLESLFTLASRTAKEKYFDIDKLDIPMPKVPVVRFNRRQLRKFDSFEF